MVTGYSLCGGRDGASISGGVWLVRSMVSAP